MTTQQVSELVARAQRGESRAFADLYEAYSPAMYRFLRRRLDGPDEVVQDLTADVFAKAYEKLDRYVERGLPFTAWLYRIAHNHLVDHLRALPRYMAGSLDEHAEVAEHRGGAALGRVLDRQVLEPALARLTDEQRQAIRLRFFEGLNVAQAAAAMGRSDEAVKKLQARALATLRRILTAGGDVAERRMALVAA